MKVPGIVSRVGAHLEATRWVPEGARVLAAVSGGPDSVALADILHKLGLLGAIAHCNFGLRQEAWAETQLVMALGDRFQVPVFIRHFSPESDAFAGRSVQAWARDLRYAFLEETMHAQGYTLCATAHHRDDQVETILMGLLRSRDERVLRGIPPKRGPYIRPLLDLSKQDLLDHCQAQALPFAIDASNLETDYLRNQFRLQLLPLLRTLNPSFEKRILEASEDNRMRDEWMGGLFEAARSSMLAEEEGGTQFLFEAAAMGQPPLPLQLVLPWWLRQIGLSGQEIRNVLDLAQAHAGKLVLTTAGTFARNHAGILHRKPATDLQMESMQVEIGNSSLRFGHWHLEFAEMACTGPVPKGNMPGFETYYMDAGRVHFPLMVRAWRKGDRIQPFGMQGSRKLSDVFADRHEDAKGKAQAFVLEDSRGEVLLLSGFRISAKVAISAYTRHMLRLSCRINSPTM